MITTRCIKRMAMVAAVLAAMVAMHGTAHAKFSKASTKFRYDHVSVEVIDRHKWIGQTVHSDTYGYAIYKNDNDVPVNIRWICYGVFPNESRVAWLDEGTFDLLPGKVRKEVYNYDSGHFTHRDFSKYVIAIEVTKKPAAPEPEPTEGGGIREIEERPTRTADGFVGPDNVDQVYQQLLQLMRRSNLTQDEYSLFLRWLHYTMNEQIMPHYNEAFEHKNKNRVDAANQVRQEHADLIERFQEIYSFMGQAYREGKITHENENDWSWLMLDHQVKYTIR